MGGSSAGANIFGAFVFTHPAGQEATPLNDLTHYLLPLGFDFIHQSALMSHFSQRHLETAIPKIREVHPELLVIGMDEATSIVVHNGIFTVAGPGTVSVYEPPRSGDTLKPLVLKDGQRFDLSKHSAFSLDPGRSNEIRGSGGVSMIGFGGAFCFAGLFFAGGVFPTVRYLRIFSRRFGPRPRIASKSSTFLKEPYDLRICKILPAVTGPIPGTSCNSSKFAVLMLIGCAGGFFLANAPGAHSRNGMRTARIANDRHAMAMR